MASWPCFASCSGFRTYMINMTFGIGLIYHTTIKNVNLLGQGVVRQARPSPLSLLSFSFCLALSLSFSR